MPGFQISNHQVGQKALPSKVVYTYTWEFGLLVETKTTNLYLKDISLPSYSFDTDTIKTGHAQYEFAKGIKWQDVKLTFYDVNGWGPQLEELSKKIWSPDTGIQLANDYMGESHINVYYSDNTPAYIWKLFNSWIKSVSFSKLTYESSGVNNVSVTLAYAWAEIDHLEHGTFTPTS
jgi:hypothetical protein